MRRVVWAAVISYMDSQSYYDSAVLQPCSSDPSSNTGPYIFSVWQKTNDCFHSWSAEILLLWTDVFHR